MALKKTLYLANPYGFSTQQREGPLQELVAALEEHQRRVDRQAEDLALVVVQDRLIP